MLQIFLGQLTFILALLIWLAAFPSRTLISYLLQLTVVILALVAAAGVGIWLFPPYWLPIVAIIIAGIVALFYLHKWKGAQQRPSTMPLVVSRTGFALMTLACAYFLTRTTLARQEPANVDHVELEWPLESGAYLVVNGGNSTLINAHQKSLDTNILRLRPWRGNGHAVDIVAIDAFGMRTRGIQPEDPARYRIFGVGVLSPCDGEVVMAVDGLQDMRVPDYDRKNMAGNHIILRCMGVHVVLAHLRRGSITVGAGDAVAAGMHLGDVGNSGGSDEPHLHIHAQRPGSSEQPFSADPVTIRLTGRYLTRGTIVHIGQPLSW